MTEYLREGNVRPATFGSFVEEAVTAAPWLSLGSPSVTPAFLFASQRESAAAESEADAATRERLRERAAEQAQRQRLEAELEALREAAVAEGFAAGEAAARTQYEELNERLGALLVGLAEGSREALGNMEAALAEIVVAVAQTVIGRQWRSDATYLYPLIQEALSVLGDAEETEIRLSPSDNEALRELAADLATEFPRLGRLRFKSDPEIELGCVVETKLAVVDATLASRLASVREELGGAVS